MTYKLTRFLKTMYWSFPLELQLKILLLRRKSFLNTGPIFIHIPKNGGSSFSSKFYGKNLGHLRAQDIDVTGNVKFAFVRDPLERFVSAHNFLSGGGTDHMPIRLQNNLIKGRPISYTIENLHKLYKIDFALYPQNYWVDAETVLLPLQSLDELLGDVTRLNVSNVTYAVEDLTSAQKKKIREFYTLDIVLFELAQSEKERNVGKIKGLLAKSSRNL